MDLMAFPTARFHALSLEQGLPDTKVRAITQDSYGFIWLATDSGLARYDGYEVLNFEFSESVLSQLVDKNVRALLDDGQKTLWIGTFNNGLKRYDYHNETYQEYFSEPENNNSLSANRVYSLVQNSQGHLLVGTAKGLNLFRPDEGKFRRIPLRIANGPAFSDQRVRCLIVTQSGQILVGTSHGLLVFNEDNLSFTSVVIQAENSTQVIRSLHQDLNGTIWIGTHVGLFVWNKGTNQAVPYLDTDGLEPFKNKRIYAIQNDSEGNIWLGGRGLGLCRVSSHNSARCYKYDKGMASSLRDNFILSLFIDSFQQVWVGTYLGGANKLDLATLKFGFYDHSASSPIKCLRYPKVNSILVEDENIHWFGTEDGLVRYDSGNEDCQYFPSQPDQPHTLSHKEVYSVYRDSYGILWIGTGRGLNRLDKSLAIQRVPGAISKLTINYMHEHNGRLFVATSRGLFQYLREQDEFVAVDILDKRLNTYLWSLLSDKKGTLWIASANGLGIYTSESQQVDYWRSQGEPVFTQVIGAMYLAKDGTLWLGIDDVGLIQFDSSGKEIKRFDKKDKLPNLKFSFISEDSLGHLWISTRLGLVKLEPTSRKLHVYRESDGLQGNFFMQNAGYKTSQGKIFLGGEKGVNGFFPNDIKNSDVAPEVVIANLYRFNQKIIPGKNYEGFQLTKPLKASSKLELGYQDYVFSLEFIGLHYANAARNQYAFKMEGVDPDWNFTNSNNRRATYTNLDPGEYIFRVKASNKDGTWNEQEKNLRVSISGPWWLSWWAIGCYVFSALIFALVIYRWRTQQLLFRNVELETIVAERTQALASTNKEIQKLLSTKDKLLIDISHEFKTPLTVLYGAFDFIIKIAERGNESLKAAKLTNQVKHMIRLVEQITQLSRLENNSEVKRVPINLSECLSQIIPMFDSMAKTLDLEIRVAIEEALVVDAEPHSFELIFTNLISNAIKYNKQGGFVAISAYKEEHIGIVKIVDSGVGIAPQDKNIIFKRFGKLDNRASLEHQVSSSGLGLAIVKEAIATNRGQLDMDSELNVGTTFSLRFPLSNQAPSSLGVLNYKADLEVISKESLALNQENINQDESALNTVLIIDDVPDVAESIVESLTGEFNLLIALGGKQGIEMAKQNLPDLVVSDIMMPGVDGFEVLMTLKQDELTSHIPILLLTAMGDSNARVKGFELHADDFLEKPFSADELRYRIKNKLEYRDILRRQFDLSLMLEERKEQDVNKDACQKLEQVADTLQIKRFDVSNLENESKRRFITKINNWLDDNIDQSIKTADLANHLALSPKQLGRKLKQITSFNTVEYIRSYRLVRAYERLPQETNIAHLAYDLGFSSQNYFANAFKAYFGIQPKERQNGEVAKKGVLF